jgi:hypothetical protein
MLWHAIIKQQLAVIIKSSQCDMDLINSRTDISLVFSQTPQHPTKKYIWMEFSISTYIYTHEDCRDYTGLHLKLESQEGLETHLKGKQYLEVLMPQTYSASRNLKTITQTGNPSRYSQGPQMLKLCTFSYNGASQPFPLNVRAWRSRVRIPALKSAIVTVVVYDFP